LTLHHSPTPLHRSSRHLPYSNPGSADHPQLPGPTIAAGPYDRCRALRSLPGPTIAAGPYDRCRALRSSRSISPQLAAMCAPCTVIECGYERILDWYLLALMRCVCAVRQCLCSRNGSKEGRLSKPLNRPTRAGCGRVSRGRTPSLPN
jgi:hypothetical protein